MGLLAARYQLATRSPRYPPAVTGGASALRFHGIEDELGEIVNGLIEDVMFDEEKIVFVWVFAIGCLGVICL